MEENARGEAVMQSILQRLDNPPAESATIAELTALRIVVRAAIAILRRDDMDAARLNDMAEQLLSDGLKT